MYPVIKHTAQATAFSLIFAGAAMASQISDTYSSFWVLGDSLSDNGNLFAATAGAADGPTPSDPPYFNGRFSNGPVWNENILSDFTAAGKASGNFAFGGARTSGGDAPSLEVQSGVFAANAVPALGDNPLVTLWFGANDLFQAIGGSGSAAVAIDAANAVTSAAIALSSFGVENFVIANLPDLSLIPSYTLFQPGDAEDAAIATGAFNAQLKGNIAGLEARGLNIIDIDVTGLFSDAFADPASFDLTDTTLPCVFPNADVAALFGQPQVCDADTANTRLFFDAVHPNSKAHGAIEDLIRTRIAQEQVSPVPLPASAPLILGGLFLLGLIRRRSSL